MLKQKTGEKVSRSGYFEKDWAMKNHWQKVQAREKGKQQNIHLLMVPKLEFGTYFILFFALMSLELNISLENKLKIWQIRWDLQNCQVLA